jgi:hypothetical protein
VKTLSTTKFRLSKLLLVGLLSFFIFSESVPSFAAQQGPVRTERLIGQRSIKPNFFVVKFYQSEFSTCSSFVEGFLSSFEFYSRSVDVSIKHCVNQVAAFTPIGMYLIADFLPRSKAEFLFSNQG